MLEILHFVSATRLNPLRLPNLRHGRPFSATSIVSSCSRLVAETRIHADFRLLREGPRLRVHPFAPMRTEKRRRDADAKETCALC